MYTLIHHLFLVLTSSVAFLFAEHTKKQKCKTNFGVNMDARILSIREPMFTFEAFFMHTNLDA
jgi:hypothetical protein